MLKEMNFLSNYMGDEDTDENTTQPIYRLSVPMCFRKVSDISSSV